MISEVYKVLWYSDRWSKAMVRSQTGLVGLLKKNKINCVALHCIIHQEAFRGKVLEMMNAMPVIQNGQSNKRWT